MKQSAQVIEIDKLKKQVEKLESEKKAVESKYEAVESEKNVLKQSEKSLKGKLSTANAKIKKYREALKEKKDAERAFGLGTLQINDFPIGRHHYKSLMVALSVAFYTRLNIGSRQVVGIFNILNEFMGDIFGKVPAYTTIGY